MLVTQEGDIQSKTLRRRTTKVLRFVRVRRLRFADQVCGREDEWRVATHLLSGPEAALGLHLCRALYSVRADWRALRPMFCRQLICPSDTFN